jgi:membrane-associated phospholipid phosphatase
MVIGSVVTGALKMAFGRARPYASSRSDDWQLGRGFQGSAWQSFPSGHTTVAFAAATGLTLAVAERDRGAAVAVAVGLVSLATATTMGVARMYLNAHWATDVMAGAAVGTLAGVATMAIHRTASGARIDRAFLGMHVDPRGITPLLGLLP